MTNRTSSTLLSVFLLLLPGAPLRAQATPPSKAKVGPARPARPGEVRQNLKDGLKYVWIPPGSFQMGCSPGDSACLPRERPSHRVTISKGFWLGQTEVTVEAYRRFVNRTGHWDPDPEALNSAPDEMPIINLTWDDAQAYCRWAGGRLPTEAEWEHAARAGKTNARYGPIDDIAWHSANSPRRIRQVGLKRPNAWGLYDMLGNVWEWVNDWADDEYYKSSPHRDPTGPTISPARVLRGGSVLQGPAELRVSRRDRSFPGTRLITNGCRCARDAAP